jgi:DtxR family Mn-dependent transcriptional regulator
MASQTVENYLKAIYQAERELASPGALVPMGRLASAMGVVPGTATTMVKALAGSGLADYEAYAGVRLTPAGKRLAALVLRRHRLVEQFLVQVMGMPWDEVHEEAERLEHAVSDRLIDRIDEMLGHPAVDPHGDPIPDPEGAMAAPHEDTLRSCPPDVQVRVVRVTDQSPEFLQRVDRHGLRPGTLVTVTARDADSGTVRLAPAEGGDVTLDAGTAARLQVERA